jgi:hypothetical protein
MMVDQQQATGAKDVEQDQLIVARMFHGIVIATPQRDSLWDRVKIHQVHDKLVKYLAAKQPPALILDLEKVEIVSSEALSILLRIRDHAVARNLQLRLCNLQPRAGSVENHRVGEAFRNLRHLAASLPRSCCRKISLFFSAKSTILCSFARNSIHQAVCVCSYGSENSYRVIGSGHLGWVAAVTLLAFLGTSVG